MATQFVPFSPFTMFQQNGPLGFFPNNFAANAGDLPNVLWVSSLQTPLLNSFSPVFPPLVTDIFGGGPLPLGAGFRPAPLGANPNSGLNGTNIPIPGSGQQPQLGGQVVGGNNGVGSINVNGNGVPTGSNTGALTGMNGINNIGSTTNGLSQNGGLSFGIGGGPGFGAVGGQGFTGNGAFGQLLGLNTGGLNLIG